MSAHVCREAKMTARTKVELSLAPPPVSHENSVIGDRGYLFNILILNELISSFIDIRIKTYRILIKEFNNRKDTLEHLVSLDGRFISPFCKEYIISEAKHIIKEGNIEPLDYYR